MTRIVDTSVVLKWFVAEPDSDTAIGLTDQVLMAPDLLRAELANALATKARRGEILGEQALAALAEVDVLIRFLPGMELATRALELALELHHPAYDCFFLALAEATDAVVVTADARFHRRCAASPYAQLVELLA